MILYKGKAKDYSLRVVRKAIAKNLGVIVHRKVLLSELNQKENICPINKSKL
jgi:hypothetical protein